MNTPIPVQSIEALRLTCPNCRVAIIMPLATTREVPHKCFNCCKEFQAYGVQDLISNLLRVRSLVEKQDPLFMVHVEHNQGG
ncbi:conserved hypothetical protein [Gammaproteobacteria bacterium]